MNERVTRLRFSYRTHFDGDELSMLVGERAQAAVEPLEVNLIITNSCVHFLISLHSLTLPCSSPPSHSPMQSNLLSIIMIVEAVRSEYIFILIEFSSLDVHTHFVTSGGEKWDRDDSQFNFWNYEQCFLLFSEIWEMMVAARHFMNNYGSLGLFGINFIGMFYICSQDITTHSHALSLLTLHWHPTTSPKLQWLDSLSLSHSVIEWMSH